MRERCRLPSRYQCIRYVVSYPRLSRMTRRNGTAGYRRFGVRDAAFRAGDLAAAGRRAGGFGAGLGAGWDFGAVSAARAFSAAADRWTSAKRIWSPTD